MTFYDEIKDYTPDDLEVIIATQKDLYTEEEMAQMQSLLKQKLEVQQAEYRAKVIARLPNTILCPKCDGPNDFSNEECVFCSLKLDKTKYYQDEYYDSLESDEDIEFDGNCGKSYAFHYIISLIVPLVGFIVGAIMLCRNTNTFYGLIIESKKIKFVLFKKEYYYLI